MISKLAVTMLVCSLVNISSIARAQDNEQHGELLDGTISAGSVAKFSKKQNPTFLRSPMLPTSRRFPLNFVRRSPALPAALFGEYELSQCHSM